MSVGGKVLVIGSGFGGAISAARIAEAGFDVTLVERGPWRDSLPVQSMGVARRTPHPTGRHLFTTILRSIRAGSRTFTLNRRGFLEFTITKGLNVISASNVGGGSHAYGGLNMRPPKPGYWDAAGLSDAQMERHYRSVEARMNTALPAPAHMRNSAGKWFADSAWLSADDALSALPMGMLFPADTANSAVVERDGIRRHEARPGRDGTFGSPGGAKTSLDFAYLHPAMRDHGLKVFDLTEALTIHAGDGFEGGRYRVALRDLCSNTIRHHDSDHVFVAAGTLNTLELLFRSRSCRGLRGMQQLGEHFFANGDLAFTCKLPKGRHIDLSIPVDGAVRCREGVQLLGDRPWPLMIISGLPLADMPLPKILRRRMQRSIVIAGMGCDAGGRVRYENGHLRIEYDTSGSEIYEDVRAAAQIIASELAGVLHGRGTPSTAHPMGGACMGASEQDAVVDRNGEVFGHPGLYVADAAALPAPVGGPPSITIGAWAEYVAECFVARHRAVEKSRKSQ